MKIHALSANQLLGHIRSGTLTAAKVYQGFLDRVTAVEGVVRAFVPRVQPSGGEALEKMTADGDIPLPIGIKDNICCRGMETTCASKILEGFIPPYDATVIKKIRDKGLRLFGHTNMDEFAFGSSTENSCYGPTGNPWDTGCVPGGSSGGSAAAVAAQEVPWALGSDTGGSIRQPASFCGVVGIKPTYGRVSRYGLIAFASSLDQIGPLTRTTEDAALLLNIIAGHDEMDSTSADIPVPDYQQALDQDLRGITVGVPKEYFIEGIDPEVAAAVRDALSQLQDLGAKILEISLPHTEYCVATYYIIATAEASSNLARYDGVRYGLRSHPVQGRKTPLVDMFEKTREQGFGPEVKRRVMLGTFSLSSGYYDAYYLRGQKTRTLIKEDFDKAFTEVDVIVTPTSPTTAFKIGEKTSDPLSMYLSDVFTISANLSGVPAISLPCGFDRRRMPIGLQIFAKPFDEATMLRVAYHYEQKAGWFKQTAPVRTA